MKKLLVSLVALMLMPMAALATPITADFTGTRSVHAGLSATDGGKESKGWASKGFTLSWQIQQVTGGYDYTYTLDPLYKGEVSNFILEVSPVALTSDFRSLMEGKDHLIYFAPTSYTSDGNVAFSAPLFGIKFDFGGDPSIYHFFSKKAPVWGDFFAKDGDYGEVWNTGFGQDPTGSPFTNWIATPDSTATVPTPEPGTMVLLGAGLMALAVYGKRRQKTQ